MNNIREIMLRDHGKLLKLLADFKTADKANPNISRVFDNFKWNLEKHIFAEEKAIFVLMQEMVGLEVQEIFDLMKEHGEIMGLIKNIEDNLKLNQEADISEILQTLKAHSSFEDEVFYPKLEETLNENQKEELIRRIKSLVVY